ncbi:MAG TPA: HAMP domain-containing protein [Bacillota bacterium]|nr:HAMP domain-containing protein [Bacillota bacterium]
MRLKKPCISDWIKARISITTKIALALSFLITFLITSLGASLVYGEYSLLKREFQENGWNIVHTALQFSRNYIQINNPEYLDDLVREIGTYKDVSYVAVLDAGGKVLAHTDNKQKGMVYNDKETKNAMAEKKDVIINRPAEKGKNAIMDFYSPIFNPNGSILGYFRMGIDLSGLNRNTRESALTIALICLVAIIAGINLSSLISKKILQKPLQDLTIATEKLATGDFSHKVPIRNRDELGDLAASFNTMSVNLANLIQSVKSSAADINKSAEQIIGRIQTSDCTNSRLSHTFDLLKQGASEQLSILKESINLADQLSDQTSHAMDRILQILNEVSNTAQAVESIVSAISSISLNIEDSLHSLEHAKNSLAQLESKGHSFKGTIDFFSKLQEKNIACTVHVALHAARLGATELTEAAENLHNITEESVHHINQMSSELENILKSWSETEQLLDGNLERMGVEKEALGSASESIKSVVNALLQSKNTIEEIASASYRQSAGIDSLIKNQNNIVEELTKLINKSYGTGDDTKLQTVSLHDIDSLAKKLIRMVDRLNVLSLQFKI